MANTLRSAFPNDEIIFVYDKAHFPYGGRTSGELLSFVLPILQDMIATGCEVIVVACNTVSTSIIKHLRDCVQIPLIAMEPMVKPAATLTKTGVIAVCATPTTLASARYAWLKQTYAADITVLEPDCSDWSSMIEKHAVDEQKIAMELESVIRLTADVIVLGCTHYHWIEADIKVIAAGRALVIQPEMAIAAQLKRVIARLV